MQFLFKLSSDAFIDHMIVLGQNPDPQLDPLASSDRSLIANSLQTWTERQTASCVHGSATEPTIQVWVIPQVVFDKVSSW